MGTYSAGVAAEDRMVEEILESLKLHSIQDAEIIRDVCYKTASGMYAQADAVLICSRGLYCIEFKCWSGEVYPTSDKSWAVIRRNNFRRMWANPVIQNGRHKFVLDVLSKRNVSGFGDNHFRNIVVFDRQAKLVNNEFKNVMNIGQFVEFVYNHDEEIDLNVVDDVSKFMHHLVRTNKYHFEQQHATLVRDAKKNRY